MGVGVVLAQATLIGAVGQISAASTFMEMAPVLSDGTTIIRADRHVDDHAKGTILDDHQIEHFTALDYMVTLSPRKAMKGFLWYIPEECPQKNVRLEELQVAGMGLCVPIPINAEEYLYYVALEGASYRQKWAQKEYDHALDLFFSPDKEGTHRALHNCLELFRGVPPKLVGLQGALAYRQGQNMDLFWQFMHSRKPERFVLEAKEDFKELIS